MLALRDEPLRFARSCRTRRSMPLTALVTLPACSCPGLPLLSRPRRRACSPRHSPPSRTPKMASSGRKTTCGQAPTTTVDCLASRASAGARRPSRTTTEQLATPQAWEQKPFSQARPPATATFPSTVWIRVHRARARCAVAASPSLRQPRFGATSPWVRRTPSVELARPTGARPPSCTTLDFPFARCSPPTSSARTSCVAALSPLTVTALSHLTSFRWALRRCRGRGMLMRLARPSALAHSCGLAALRTARGRKESRVATGGTMTTGRRSVVLDQPACLTRRGLMLASKTVTRCTACTVCRR
mmetsp:Transcript_15473/g.48375  ORF Transcript_15473/g.48375 Transcript_15473/m.48375 type:complete len:302 (-) Transcript_15473:4227-5132(-)